MKIKQFFTNIFSKIKEGLSFVGKQIAKFFRMIFQSKPMQKVGYVLGYIPNKIGDRLTNAQRKSAWGVIFLIPLLIGFVYFFLIPLVLTVTYSFSFVHKFNSVEGLTTINVGWNNYIYVFKDFVISINYENKTFAEVLVTSFVEIITNLPIILIFSLIMAVVLNSKFAGRTFVRAVFFMPVIFNSQAIDLAVAARTGMSAIVEANQQKIFDNMFSFKDFLLNANLPVKLVNFLSNASTKIYDVISYSGIQILIFLSAIQSVPVNLYEAAKMEGATAYEIFWKITFPMVSPMLLTTAVYTIVDSYTRSTMIKAITKFSDAKKSTTTEATGLIGKALDKYNQLTDGEKFTGELNQLSNYGIGAALSIMYALLVIVIIVIVLGILSKAVFYYDN